MRVMCVRKVTVQSPVTQMFQYCKSVSALWRLVNAKKIPFSQICFPLIFRRLKREAKRKRKAEEEASKAAALPEVDPSAYGYARSAGIHTVVFS